MITPNKIRVNTITKTTIAYRTYKTKSQGLVSQVPKVPSELKIRLKTKTPQEKFLEALNDFEEVDPEIWATHFPPGYRERMAPHSLGETYATGKTAKEVAKAFVKEKELGDCDEAREIIPASAALDAIFLVDQVPGAINQVGTEQLVRKVFGIREAFANVKCAADWKKTGKKTASKIDYEQWQRVDPSKKDSEHIFVNRKVEDEQRAEMERDAQMIKAKSKLAEAGKKGK